MMSEKKRGRPEKLNKRKYELKVRLNEDEYGELLTRVNSTGDNYSDVVRKALRLYYRMTKLE